MEWGTTWFKGKIWNRPHHRLLIQNSQRSLSREGDLWVACDGETGVASQGKTREEALAMLDGAVSLHRGEIADPVTDEDFEEFGLDPCELDNPEVPVAPWFDDVVE